MMRCMARPATTSCAAAARAASATARMRATLEAKIVTATRRLAPADDLGERLGDVESRRASGPRAARWWNRRPCASTPSSPSCLSSASSVGSADERRRRRSSSRRCAARAQRACGSRRALGSGIECATVRVRGRTGRRLKRPPSGTSLIGSFSLPRTRRASAAASPPVNGVA